MSETTCSLPGLTPSDRRIAPRIPCELFVDSSPLAGGGSIALTDLSANGCSIRTASPIKMGGRLMMSVRLPDTLRNIELVGVVRRCDTLGDGAYSLGLEFSTLSPDSRRFLADYVHTRLDEPCGVLELPRQLGASRWGRRHEDGIIQPTLSWQPPSLAVLVPLLERLVRSRNLFVPCDTRELAEGARLVFQLLVPETHLSLTLPCEVIWVQAPTEHRPAGLGLLREDLQLGDEPIINAILGLCADVADSAA